MENALEAGLGHMLETLARNEPLVNISCDENGFMQATLKDVAKYKVFMIQLLYLEADAIAAQRCRLHSAGCKRQRWIPALFYDSTCFPRASE